MKKTYHLELTDFYTDENGFKTIEVGEYESVESAAEAGWAIGEAFAAIHGLEIENQGDQFMCYYSDGHKDEGMGALTIEIYDNEGIRIEDL